MHREEVSSDVFTTTCTLGHMSCCCLLLCCCCYLFVVWCELFNHSMDVIVMTWFTHVTHAHFTHTCLQQPASPGPIVSCTVEPVYSGHCVRQPPVYSSQPPLSYIVLCRFSNEAPDLLPNGFMKPLQCVHM